MTAAVAAVAVERITSGPVDPDLEQAMSEFAMHARRIRQLESIIRLPTSGYATRAAQLAERSDLYDRFTARAEKLALPGDKPGRTLLLLVEEADRQFQAAKRRRPTLAQVLVGVRAITAAAERDLSEAESDLVAARTRELTARHRLEAGEGAIAYLEASR